MDTFELEKIEVFQKAPFVFFFRSPSCSQKIYI